MLCSRGHDLPADSRRGQGFLPEADIGRGHRYEILATGTGMRGRLPRAVCLMPFFVIIDEIIKIFEPPSDCV